MKQCWLPQGNNQLEIRNINVLLSHIFSTKWEKLTYQATLPEMLLRKKINIEEFIEYYDMVKLLVFYEVKNLYLRLSKLEKAEIKLFYCITKIHLHGSQEHPWEVPITFIILHKSALLLPLVNNCSNFAFRLWDKRSRNKAYPTLQ